MSRTSDIHGGRPNFVLDDDDESGVGRDDVDGLGSVKPSASSGPAVSTTSAGNRSRSWYAWMWGDKAEAERAARAVGISADDRSVKSSAQSTRSGVRDTASMGWLESVSHQWETGTGLFGPLVPEPPKEEIKAAERERQRTEWDQRPKRPGLVSRLSSAVSMTLFSGGSSSAAADRSADR